VITEEHRLRQYKPLIVLDASQSVTKLRIDMEKWNLNAVFWSMHKIGGAQGLGVLVINDDSKHKFRPLIGGSQQSGLRGGTLGLTDFISAEKLLKMRPIKTSQAWKAAVDYLKDSGMDVVIPTKQHLFNTILIRLKHCPLGVINRLAKKQIYVGAISACALEQYIDNPQKAKEEVESFIRLSFVDPLQVDRKVLTEIIAAVKQAQALEPSQEKELELAPASEEAPDLILGGLGEEEEEYLTEIAFA
jgi:cysteine sulfinate desulfinase/cysteine desulfurase-like protein